MAFCVCEEGEVGSGERWGEVLRFKFDCCVVNCLCIEIAVRGNRT